VLSPAARTVDTEGVDPGGWRAPRSGAVLATAAATAVFVAAVYAVVVVGGGLLVGARGPDLRLAVLATAVVAVTLEPVRRALTAYLAPSADAVLADFTHRLSAPLEKGPLGAQMARLLAEGTSARRVEVWLAGSSPTGSGELIGRWPVAAEPIDPADPAVLAHPLPPDGAPIGRILRDCVAGSGSPKGTSSPVEAQLLDDLLASAVVALRPLALTADLEGRIAQTTAQAAELRASRSRVVAAADAARERVEHDIHDGAQQHLVALTLNLSLAATVVGRDPLRAATVLQGLRPAAEAALCSLAELSRGIYPSLLTEAGLGPALRSASATSPVPVDVRDTTGRRFPAEVEAAVYFAALEAVQNALKHASAQRVQVRLSRAGGALAVDVEDDGAGLDPAAAVPGTGLDHLRDRVESVGGHVVLRARDGGGTTVSARVPVPRATPVLLDRA
jgi:signal transduction histidine kinase